MSVPYTDIDAKVIAWASDRLAASPTVQTLMNVETVAAARALIIELDTESPPTDCVVVVAAPSITSTRSTVAGDFEEVATIRAVIEYPYTNGDTLAEAHRRAASIAGAIRREIQAENHPFLNDINTDATVRRSDDEGTARGGWFVLVITLTTGAMPC